MNSQYVVIAYTSDGEGDDEKAPHLYGLFDTPEQAYDFANTKIGYTAFGFDVVPLTTVKVPA